MWVIWLGAALFIGGIIFMAGKALWRGPLSVGRRRGSLEPPAQPGPGIFGFATNWPGIGMVVVGSILLLAGALNGP